MADILVVSAVTLLVLPADMVGPVTSWFQVRKKHAGQTTRERVVIEGVRQNLHK